MNKFKRIVFFAVLFFINTISFQNCSKYQSRMIGSNAIDNSSLNGNPEPSPGTGNPLFIEPPISDAQTPCEVVGNPHTAGASQHAQHTFFDVKNSQVVGTLLAKSRPQFFLQNYNEDRQIVFNNQEDASGWKNMNYVGDTTDGSGMKAWVIKYKTDGQPKWIYFRTISGCTKYIDGHSYEQRRTQPQWSFDSNRIFPTALNTLEGLIIENNLPPVDTNNLSHEEVPIQIVSNLEDNENADANYNPVVWGMNFYNKNVTHYRILSSHGGPDGSSNDWISTVEEGPYMTKRSQFWVKKDFTFEIRLNNGKMQRFFVYRNHLGGHFSVNTTVTRHDGLVYFHSMNLDTSNLNMAYQNKTTGTVGTNLRMNGTGNLYRLGVLSNGTYNLKTFHELTGYVVGDDLVVKVLKP